jgi:hypothetical protein
MSRSGRVTDESLNGLFDKACGLDFGPTVALKKPPESAAEHFFRWACEQHWPHAGQVQKLAEVSVLKGDIAKQEDVLNVMQQARIRMAEMVVRRLKITIRMWSKQ